MMLRVALVAFLFAAPEAIGQVALYQMQGSTEVRLTTLLDLGTVTSGEERSVRIRLRNLGSEKATVATLQVRGGGFSMQPGLAPVDLLPGLAFDFLVKFAASTPADYSATLQVNSTTVFLIARVTPGVDLTVLPECLLTSTNTIEFGTVVVGEKRLCTVRLRNPGAAELAIQTLSVTGGAFTGPEIPVPVTLQAGEIKSFSIEFLAPAAGFAYGTLLVQSRTYDLHGTVVNPPLPRPMFDFGPLPFSSAQQRTLMLRLEQPAPYSANGVLEMAFAPNGPNTHVDPAISFLPTGVRSVPFTVTQGSAAVAIAGASSVVFQTGTTAGVIRFTLTGIPQSFTANPSVSIALPPAPIRIDSVVANRKGAALELKVVAFDNTYTAGSMAFRFFDTGGNSMGGPIYADFSGAFKTYFDTAGGSSAFQVVVTFPVTGDGSRIGSIQADLANSASVTRTPQLNFP